MGSPGGYAQRSLVFPPEKGSFPLDHFKECIEQTTAYQDCLHNNNNQSASCHHLAKAYLQCRMDKGLMSEENLDNLGFKRPAQPVTQQDIEKHSSSRPRDRTTIAGLSSVRKMREAKLKDAI